jgi:hypothetical protein
MCPPLGLIDKSFHSNPKSVGNWNGEVGALLSVHDAVLSTRCCSQYTMLLSVHDAVLSEKVDFKEMHRNYCTVLIMISSRIIISV